MQCTSRVVRRKLTFPVAAQDSSLADDGPHESSQPLATAFDHSRMDEDYERCLIWSWMVAAVVNRYDDPAYASTRSDLLALLDDVMNHDVRREPTVGLVA